MISSPPASLCFSYIAISFAMPPIRQVLLPQVPSTCCSFCLEYPSLRYLYSLPPCFYSYSSLLKCHLIRWTSLNIYKKITALRHSSTSKPSLHLLTLLYFSPKHLYHQLAHPNLFKVFLSQLKYKFHAGRALFSSLLYSQRPRIVPHSGHSFFFSKYIHFSMHIGRQFWHDSLKKVSKC